MIVRQHKIVFISARLTRIFASLVALVSVIVLFGWYSGWMFLASIIPEEIPMAMSTAVCFLILSFALWNEVHLPEYRYNRFFSFLAVFLVISICGFIILGSFMGFSTEWEHFYLPVDDMAFPFIIGHMSFVTAALFLALSLALLLSGGKSKFSRDAGSFFSFFTFLCSLVILLGYCLKTPFFYSGSLIPPASLTALSFLFASMGVLSSTDKSAFVIAILTRKSTGGKLMAILLPFTIALTILESIVIVQILPHLPINPAIGIFLLTLFFVGFLSFMIPIMANVIGKSLDSALISLKLSEEKFRNLFENSPEGISMTRLDGSLQVNKAFCQILGYTEAEMSKLKWMDVTHPDDINRTGAAIQSLIKEEVSVVRFEKRFIHKNLNIVWTDLTSYLQRDEKGEPQFFITSISDITRNKLREELLMASENKYRRLIENSPDIVYVFSQVRGGIYYSPSAVKILGYSIDFLLQNPFLWNESIHPDDLPMVRSAVGNLIAGGSYSVEYRIRDINDNWLWFFDRSIGKFLLDDEILMEGLVTDITERKKAENELIAAKEKAEESIQKHRSILRTAMDGFWMIDLSGRIVEVNETFCKMIGYSEQELLSMSVSDVEVNEKPSDTMDRIRKIQEFGEDRFESVHRCKDGRLIDLEISVQFKLENSIHLVAFMRDITQRKKTEMELIIAKESAEESDHLKSALLNNLSHEIRTPMNAIMGFSGLLSEANMDEVRSYSKIIQKSSENLLSMLDDVILISRLQSEKMPKINQVCVPAEIVSHVFQLFSTNEYNKNLTFRKMLPENHKDILLVSDENKIQQVLVNFVSNAFKYTFEGSIELGFELMGDKIEFYVQDTGIGISVKEQRNIFKTFYRGVEAQERAIRGSGLGLNISKELVEILGGTIVVESEPLKGSRFSFCLPCQLKKHMDAPQKTDHYMMKRTAGLSVLIVDDEIHNFVFLNILLRDFVQRTDHAIHGELAVEMASSTKYDLVLMDLKMPVMDGFEATKILKARYPDIKIVAQSAYSLPEEKEQARKAGCDDFLSKPIKKERFMEVVSKYF